MGRRGDGEIGRAVSKLCRKLLAFRMPLLFPPVAPSPSLPVLPFAFGIGMPHMRWALQLGMLTLAALLSAPAWGCSIPVCQYAMEHWPAENYEATLLHAQPLKPEEQKLAEKLKQSIAAEPHANLTFAQLDVTQARQEEQFLWKDGPSEFPRLVLSCTQFAETVVVWSARFDAAACEGLVQSPVRREIARRLAHGESAVWVLLESGDRAQDDRAARMLDPLLKKTAQELTAQRAEENPEAEWKFEFSLLRVSPGDPAEARTLDMLLLGRPKLRKLGSPVLFPVMGRGLVLGPIFGPGLEQSGIERIAEFIAGPCSCEIKDATPGHDLVLCADWEVAVAGRFDAESRQAVKEVPAAPEPVKTAPAAALGEANSAPPAPNGGPPRADSRANVSPLARSGYGGLFLALGAGIAIGGALMLLVTRRRPAGAGFILSPFWLALGGSVLLGGLLVSALWVETGGARSSTPGAPLLVFCAASSRVPMEAVARAYEREFGVAVQMEFDRSESLLTKIKLAGRGDLFIPADESYLESARGDDLIDEILPLASLTPVIAVRKGNPCAVQGLAELTSEGVRVALASPAAAVGKLSRQLLKKSGHWQALEARMKGGSGVAEVGTVTEVANSIKVGAVDAGIVWDSSVRQFPELEAIRVPLFDAAVVQTSAAVLRTSTQPAAALRFARYLAARDKGLLEFERAGFNISAGDAWAEQPELRIFCGAMLRPAVEHTIGEFERREGARVARIYNGCGILVAQMKSGERPDAYFACDASFMDMVRPMFEIPVRVSSNDMVIAVKKGNPHGIRSIRDLAGKPVKIGVGHERQCALGALTKRKLDETGLCQAVMKNVTVQSPTGDFLVNQLRTGSLDAVIVYASNVTAFTDIEPVKLDVEMAVAIQPIAVAKESKYPRMAERLKAALLSKRSEERFKSAGFNWSPGKQ